MSLPTQSALLVELCAPTRMAPRWTELGYAPQRVEVALLDACEAEPAALQQRVQFAQGAPGLLVLSCDELPVQRAAAIRDWQPVLHGPLTRCFTALRGLAPVVCAQPRGHILVFLARAALLPDGTQGSAAVLGRALLGLFESLRAELRQTTTRVTLYITDTGESADVSHARLRQVLSDRPFYSLPASVDRQTLRQYFGPMEDALARTPLGVPLPAGPQGEVYHLHQLQDSLPR